MKRCFQQLNEMLCDVGFCSIFRSSKVLTYRLQYMVGYAGSPICMCMLICWYDLDLIHGQGHSASEVQKIALF